MRRALRVLAGLILAAALGLAARQWLAGAVRIAGNSMADTLLSGDVVLVTRPDYAFGGAPRRGDIVECVFPGRDGRYVKRVVGLPGDRVEFLDGALLLNGRRISEPYVTSAAEDLRVELGPDEYFVLGDNRAESYDSRAADMGCVSRDCFLGRVRLILWPLDRLGIVE